MSSKLHHPVL